MAPKRPRDALVQHKIRIETPEERLERKAALKAAKRIRKARERENEAEKSEEGHTLPDDDSTKARLLDVSISPIEHVTVPQSIPLRSVEEQLKTRVISKESKQDKRFEPEEMFNGSVMDIAPPPMMVRGSVEAWGLDRALAEILITDGINSFFPVQRAVIPLLLQRSRSEQSFLRDICASAATGSGKTLAYAIPVVQNLMTRKFVRLRALVILPSQELCVQVYKVFCRLAKCSTLKIALASGLNSFSLEQDMLCSGGPKRKTSFSEASGKSHGVDYGNSKIDILVCTPGRLLEHLEQTDGFTLQHLRYLVLDEADRLLSNAYHHWVRELLLGWDNSLGEEHKSSLVSEVTFRIPRRPPQRLLFSATLTDNPRKLSQLHIRNPLVIRVHQENTGSEEATETWQNIPSSSKFTLPLGLTEYICVCDTETRPFLLVSMLALGCGSVSNPKTALAGICSDPGSICLIFSSSLETTHRLCCILQLINNGGSNSFFGGTVEEISRSITPEERKKKLESASAGSVKVIVATDKMARGIDLPNVSLVINYDPPKFSRSYVHRVGRTARAGRIGHCVTMLKVGQVTAFKNIRSEVASASLLQKFKLSEDEFDADLFKIYSSSLQNLSEVLTSR